MAGINIYNVQRTVTPKAGNSELWFLCFADIHLHKVSRKYLNSFQVAERTHMLKKSLYSKFKGPLFQK